MERVVVVGASVAGLHAAEWLRDLGFGGALTVIGDEPYLPYDRPPLSKQVLDGTWEPDDIVLRGPEDYEDLGVDWLVGRRASGLDALARAVVLDDGTSVPFDGAVIATGSVPRRFPGLDLAGVHALRTLDDCLALRNDLEAEPRVVIIGSGFIGSEVAAACRRRGLDVTVVEAAAQPLLGALGEEMGSICGDLQRAHGVDLRCDTTVASLEADGDRVHHVTLGDGTTIPADVVVVGVGVVPVTDWLEGSGVHVDNGVVCDASGAASVPGIVAAGDVARWFHPHAGAYVRLEHWNSAIEQAAVAAGRLLHGPARSTAHAGVPSFWSDQFGVHIDLLGFVRPDDEVRMVHGSPADGSFMAVYLRDEVVVGALAFDHTVLAQRCIPVIAKRGSFEDARALVDA